MQDNATLRNALLTRRLPERSIGHLNPTQAFVLKVGEPSSPRATPLRHATPRATPLRNAPLAHRQPVTNKPAPISVSPSR
jgi:hypothetical protein